MATIVTRAGKGSALTFAEMDANFTNLNDELANVSLGVLPENSVSATELDNSDDYTVSTLTTTGNVVVGDSLIPSSGNLEINTDYLVVSDASGVEKFKIRTDTAPGPDQVLKYNDTSGFVQWATDTGQTSTQVQSSLDSQNLGDHADVDTTGVTTGSVLRYDGVNWAVSNSIEETTEVSEDTTPQLGGDLDILNHAITSSNANVVISADSTDKDVIVKIKDAGGTLQTAATFRDATRIEEDPDASGTTTTVYEPIMDIPQGIRIGTTSANFSTSGNAADNSTSQWGTTGIVITNADKATWPQLDVISYGGNNPLLDGLGSGWNGGLATHYPNGAFNLKAANGTEGSESAILTGDNLGGFNWTGHDGSGMGGSGNRASVVLKAEANEDFSSSNDRGCKLVLEMMRTGQVSATNTRKDILDIDDTEAKIGNVSDNKYINVDSDNQELLLYDLRLDLGQQGRIRADTDVDIRLDPQGTGIVRMDTAVRLDNQGSDPSGVTDASHIYAKDDAGSSEVYVRDEAGNVTKISPHNEAGEWEYFSRNTKTGKTVRVNMEEMIRDIEQLTGKTYIRNE